LTTREGYKNLYYGMLFENTDPEYDLEVTAKFDLTNCRIHGEIEGSSEITFDLIGKVDKFVMLEPLSE
jgi:hypothetical protein